MSFTVSLRLQRAERALERLVGVAGRRGYELVGIHAALGADATHLDVQLTLSSDRSPDVLVRQLSKLREVVNISCTAARPDTTV